MKVLCKITHDRLPFIKNNWYEYEKKIPMKQPFSIPLNYKQNNHSLPYLANFNFNWNNCGFKNYFYTEKELRNLKLIEINENN